MQVYRGIPYLPGEVRAAVAIGNFDGVHLGHQALLRSLCSHAASHGEIPCALTFEPHSKEFFAPEKAPCRISTLRDKADAIASCGIEKLFFAHFSGRMASLSAEQFVKEILVDRLHASFVTVGSNFTFGQDGKAGADDLVRIGAKYGIEVSAKDLIVKDNENISSTRLRAALAAGDLKEAERLLGRPYCMSGRVVHGEHLGHTLGFPTLNLRPVPPGCHAQPALTGVFAVMVSGIVPGKELPGVTSLGNRPSIGGNLQFTCETNLLDWTGDAYGKLIRVRFVEKLRDNKRFSGLDELIAAIHNDAIRARRIFGLSIEAGGAPGA